MIYTVKRKNVLFQKKDNGFEWKVESAVGENVLDDNSTVLMDDENKTVLMDEAEKIDQIVVEKIEL